MGRRQLYLHQGLLLPCREEPGGFYTTASLGAMLISLSNLEGFERLGLPEQQQDACRAAAGCLRSSPQTLLTDSSNSSKFLLGWKELFRMPCDKAVSGFLR